MPQTNQSPSGSGKLTYEEALTLKEHGWPQHTGRYLKFQEDTTLYRQDYFVSKEELVIPTLEELIEACGNKFGGLTRCGIDYQSALAPRDENLNRVYGGWEASTNENHEDVNYMWRWGDSPIQAVANLYIALNKH